MATSQGVQAELVISEFMASNQDSIVDEDGGHSDWIEIYNPDESPVNLAGWSLTDNAALLQKWVFPAVVLPAKGFLVVFASGKDRRTPGQELHTNFSLSAGGEYLGLIKPDGVTKASEFAPGFPAQFGNISYGTSSPFSEVKLIQRGSPLRAQIPTNGVDGIAWRNIGFNDSAWLSGTLAVGFFNYNGTSGMDLSAQLGLDVKAQMGGNDKSAYIRVPFVIDDPGEIQSLKLRINYDDGFAAFLNGAPVAASNAPTPLAYNSVATTQRNPTGFVEYDLSDQTAQLVAGNNVLAIQGLNTNNSSDFFVLPEVVAELDLGAVTGYFTVATPGAANGGPETIQLPQTVTFSRAPGPFTSSFTLTMSGAAAGQEIRYIIADPSGGTGANIPAPTTVSTLYTGPVTISSSKLIRASVVDPNNGQKGAVKTVQYLWLETGGTNNTSNFTSNLPIAVLDGHGTGDGVFDVYKTSLFYVFDRVAGTASLNSTPTVFTRSGFRVRGSSSANFPKRAYAMQTWNETDQNLKLSLLGLAADSSWVWYNPWKYDDAYIRNAFMFKLSRDMGQWASRTQPVEMFLNINGGKLDYSDYWGVYVLTEKIKSGKNRLDITPIEPSDTTGDALTGGYVLKYDRADSDETSWFTTLSNINPADTNPEAKLVLVEPAREDEAPEQLAYIKNYIDQFETALLADYNSSFATRNYRKYIDVASWVDVHMLNSFALNPDSFRLSSYFHKDRNGKLKAGPIWDFDRGLFADKDAGQTQDTPREWNGTHFDMSWWKYVWRDPEFIQAWVDRWWELRSGAMSDANINAIITQMGNEIGNTVGARDAARWPGADGNTPEAGSYLGEIAALKNWLTSTNAASLGRTNWIDTQVPGPPSAGTPSGVVSAGTTVALSGAGTIRYTVNGSDPRPVGGGTSSPAPTYGGPIAINQTTVVKARRRGSFTPFPHSLTTNWSAPLTRVYLVNEAFAVAGDIAISEIHYDPAGPTAAEKAAVLEVEASDFEFIELRNVGNRTVNTFEMQFVEGMPFKALTLAPLTLAPGNIALVVKNREAFVARYGAAMNAKIVGEWGDGSLSNDGEQVKILARDGTTISDAPYSPIASGGASLNRLDTVWKSDVPSPGTFGPTYTQWKNFYFPNAGAESGDASDGDLDGAGNQIEYSHGTNPVVAENQTAYAPTFTLVNDGTNSNYAFTFKKPVYRPSAQYQVEKSTDLVSWTATGDSLVSTSLGIETRAANVSITGGARQFYRLKTTVSP